VAAEPLIDFVAGFSECLDCLATGNYRQFSPDRNLMTLSRILGHCGRLIGHPHRDYFVPVATVNTKIGVQREDFSVRVEFREPD
jgi:hypothetical protein